MKPLWFGPEGRPLFGWLHLPEGSQALGGVVLSPAMGMEGVSAHLAYRRLADQLAEHGLVALRFDYDGTGDSAGDQDDPERVKAWLTSVRHAVSFVRSLGLGRLSVVGMRVGATLTAEALAAESLTVDDLVLWDPCPSGRTFLREQSALWSFALGARSNEDGSIETPGFVYDKDTVGALSGIAIASHHMALAERVLLLTRSGRKDRHFKEMLEIPHVERVSISGQEDLVDVEPHAAEVPDDTIATITEWLVGHAATWPTRSMDPALEFRTTGLVGSAADGSPVEEVPVTLGPRGLFGIISSRRDTADLGLAGSEPSGTSSTRSRLPTIFLLNAGVLDHVGPARLWVELSRFWAAMGFTVVRFDLTGIGDSPERASAQGPLVFAPDALRDVHEVLEDISPDDPSHAVLVGLCSGAYQAVEGALANNVRGICAVNPSLTFKPLEIAVDLPPDLHAESADNPRRASGATKGWARALPAHDLLGSIVERLPGPAWWLLNRIAVESSPVRTLSNVVAGGADVLLIAGTEEARILSRGEGRAIRRLRQTGKFRMEVIPDLEHTLFERRGRERAKSLLKQYVLDQHGAGADRVESENITVS